jgi:predicted nuclease of predicted toxin-antitoxin system
MLRFHLDEHVDPVIAEALRQRGIDVTTTRSAGLISAPDHAHVAYCIEQHRVIFTNDADFLRIDSGGDEHFGIVYSAPQARNTGHIVRHLCLMHDCLEEDEMRGKVEYL